MNSRFFSHGKGTACFCAIEARLRPAVLVALVGVLAPGCIQPNTTLDDFGTDGRSSVTGDDAVPALTADGTGGDSERTETGDDGASTDDGAEEDAVDTTPLPGASKLPDAGTRPVDAGKPRADASTTPAGDAGGASADAGPSEPAAGPAPTKLSFSVTTSTLRGRYSPRNIYAIWVADAQGKFVKTLAKFAFIRARYLTGWNAASGGNVVDAVTGATMTDHGTRSVTWNLTNVSKMPVPDGDYKIVVELTDADKTGASATVPFTKGPAPVKLMPADQGSFSKMSLVLE